MASTARSQMIKDTMGHLGEGSISFIYPDCKATSCHHCLHQDKQDLGYGGLGSLESSSACIKCPEAAPWPIQNRYGWNRVIAPTERAKRWGHSPSSFQKWRFTQEKEKKNNKKPLTGGKHFWDKFCSPWSEDLTTSTAENESMNLNSILEEHSSSAESNIHYLIANMVLHYDRHGNSEYI